MAVPNKKVDTKTEEETNTNENDIPQDNLVEIKTIQNHKCNIGGKSYVFKAGQPTSVPFNVKCVLSRAGLLRG